MSTPLTADERERRFIQYVMSLHKGQIGELRLRRMGEIANFRKALQDLLNQIIEKRAEDLAAGMLMQYAPPRPQPKERVRRSLPVPLKRSVPPWIVQAPKPVVLRRAAR